MSLEHIKTGFLGISYRIANSWFDYIKVEEYNNKPINYLEIGVLCGANLISVANSYGEHPDSKLIGIDPWENYADYNENYNHNENYENCIKNIENYEYNNKIQIQRGHSYKEVPKLEDEYFDLIYIDGNHENKFVVEDAMLCWRKLKQDGIMIFDDYNVVKPAVDVLLLLGMFKMIGKSYIQVFLKKMK